MTRINLLPWRELRRKQISMQILRVSIAGWLLLALVVFFFNFHFNNLIDNQVARNVYLEGEIAKLEKQIKDIREIEKKRSALIARMEVIQQLQRDRTEIVHVFDDMVRKMPQGMYLTSLNKQSKSVVLQGVAQSNARISAFMRSLDSSEWFANPDLDVINVTNQGGERVSRFTLRVSQSERQKP